MALHVLAYNLTRIMNIMGIQLLMASMRHNQPQKILQPKSPRRDTYGKRFYITNAISG
jgi:hypothetical protein